MNTIIEQPTLADQTRAWAVHMLTASGALAGMMSLVHILRGDITGVLMWLGIALFIDSIDGPLARRFRINSVLPYVDGAILDHVIDYTTYALIPATLLYAFDFLPGGWGLAAAGVVVVTSLYCFANKDLKTKDNFFSGFPATWNLVVLGFYVLNTPAIVNLLFVPVFAALTFVPVKFVHPFRVKAFRPVTIVLTLTWAALTVFLVIQRESTANLMVAAPAAFWGFILVSVYFLVISFWRSVRGRKLDA